MNKKEVKKLITTDPEAITNTTYSNNINNKLINKSILPNNTINTTDKTRPKNYELYNIVSETGDSIYSPQYEEFVPLDDIGQVFVSETAIKEEIVNRIIIDHHHQRLGPSLNNNKNGY